MSRALKQICLTGIMVAFLFAPLAAAQGPMMREDVREDMDTAVLLFQQAEYEKAIEALDRVIENSPSSAEALVLRDRAGLGILAKMLRDPRFGPNVQKILSKASEEGARIQRDPDTIKKLIEDSGATDKVVRWKAIRHLTAVGPFAVPHLLDHALANDPNLNASRKWATLIVLRDMKSAGTLPLIVAARNSDPDDAVHIIRLLAQTRDARARALFASIANDAAKPDYLRSAAETALESLASPADEEMPEDAEEADVEIPPTADACLALALRYYYADPRIIEITPPYERVLWEWNANGANWSEKLVFKEVPQYAYPNIMAEDTLLAGMQKDDTSEALLELYVCNNYAQLDAAIGQEDERAVDLEAVHAINESLGAAYIYPALGRAVCDGNTALALRCVEALRKIGDSRAPAGENTLISALAYPDNVVRVMAAETLVHLSPLGELGGCEDVVNVLAAGMGTQAREIIAVLTGNGELAIELSELITSWNMVPKAYDDAAAVLGRVKAGVPPTNLLILDARTEMSSAVIIESIKEDARSAELPIILLAPKKDAENLRSLHGARVTAVIPLPPEPEALAIARESALASATETVRSADIRENADLLRRVLQTAASLPPETHYDAGILGVSASHLLKDYPDDIRVLALQTIETLPAPALCDGVYSVFANADEALEVRQAAGKALVQVLVAGGELSKARREALREMGSTATDPALQQHAIHAVAIASAPQAERQTYLSSVGALAQ